MELPTKREAPVEVEGDSVIRLKFLDDTQRDARTTMTDTIGKFKRQVALSVSSKAASAIKAFFSVYILVMLLRLVVW